MGLRAYARHRGCAVSAVAKAIEEQRITTILDENGKKCIDPEVADIQWAKNTRARADSKRVAPQDALAGMEPAAAAVPAAGATTAPDYNDYRARREKAEADMAERANLREAGRVLDREATERGMYDATHALRDVLMGLGQRTAPKCIGLADAREIERVITEEVRFALAQYEQRLQSLLPPLEDAPA